MAMDTVTMDTGTNELLCALDGKVATVTLNRPQKRNALSDTLTPALRQILLELEADPRVRVIVLTGAGSAFCAGGDVSGMASSDSSKTDGTTVLERSPEARIRELQHRQETLTLRLHDLVKPTIAALPGPAAGAGFAIALACDLRIAADSAFVTTAYGNIGLSGDYGASWLLTQLVGTSKAKELFFTSARVGARECLSLGIVNQVVPFDELAARTAALAAQIAQGPPVAIRYMKENLNRATRDDFRTCLAAEADRLVRSAQTQDHREAVRAFLEKRPAQFHGR
ncbi:MAG: 2-(1,2-epoxy-1,2-dihydrophenyl)acetyl-CoA isomerase [Gammaproteobacteria bacterium]|jgi:2-(1,2-epoxy-1,2-dihydrophenyl)acetyl-CoA isomerase